MKRLKLCDLSEVVAITFYGRSGSVFLQSLLDSHPNIINIPGTYIMGFNDFWELEAKGRTTNRIIEAFIKRFRVIFNTEDFATVIYGSGAGCGIALGFNQMGEEKNEKLSIDEVKFNDELQQLINDVAYVSRKDFFKAIHIAYYHALGREYNEIRAPILVFQLHTPNPERARFLLEDFPETIYLQMIREPAKTLSSHIRHYVASNNGLINFKTIAFPFNQALFGGHPIFKEVEKCSYSIKLEDLHTRPKQVLESICLLLKIKWNDILLESTFDGLKWWNLKGSLQVSGFTDKIINREQGDIFSPYDVLRLELLMAERYKKWNYGNYIWLDYEKMLELIKAPFLFEETYQFESEEEKLKTRENILMLLKNYWDEVSLKRPNMHKGLISLLNIKNSNYSEIHELNILEQLTKILDECVIKKINNESFPFIEGIVELNRFLDSRKRSGSKFIFIDTDNNKYRASSQKRNFKGKVHYFELNEKFGDGNLMVLKEFDDFLENFTNNEDIIVATVSNTSSKNLNNCLKLAKDRTMDTIVIYGEQNKEFYEGFGLWSVYIPSENESIIKLAIRSVFYNLINLMDENMED